MNYKRMSIIFLFLIMLGFSFAFAANGDYKLPEITKHIEIRDDASCVITEEILFDIEGTVNGTYRDIPIDDFYNQSITNLSVETPGYYNEIEVLDADNKSIGYKKRFTDDIRIKVWLYEDKEHTRKVDNQKVPVIIKYTFNKGIIIYDDVADFRYLSWDKQWNSDLGTLKTFIKIPGSSFQAEFWNMPSANVKSSAWNNDVLETVATNLPQNTTFTQRILLPTDYFKSRVNARVVHEHQRATIEEYQKEITDKENFKDLLFKLFEGALALLVLVSGGIYAIFGREPKIDYDGEYEYDLPTDAKALEVHALFNGEMGSVYKSAFATQILDLIDRKYYKIIHSDSEDILIKQTSKSVDDLMDYEVDTINYLNKFSDSDGYISLPSISDKETPKEYKKFIKEWTKKVENSIPDSLKKRYFDNTGSRIFRYFMLIVFIISLITFLYSINNELVSGYIGLTALVLMPLSFILACFPNTLFGRWTPEGKEADDKWQNFKKYIQDYSLINERPPESVQIWGKYLVYASALDCADKATNTMKKYYNQVENNDEVSSNDVIFFAYNGGINNMDSSFSILDTSSYDSAGGSDSSGGGFGGGGGGTF